uniref:Heat shock transcription factor 2 n=1 Tax=Chelydra serpentina TaxID=8475 RepID=A0A8C3XI31_CHESE
MKQQPASAGVPAFLSKLWALLGEAPSSQLITWSQVYSVLLGLVWWVCADYGMPLFVKAAGLRLGTGSFVGLPGCLLCLPHEKQGAVVLLLVLVVALLHPLSNLLVHVDISKAGSELCLHSLFSPQAQESGYLLSALGRSAENESLWREVAELRAKHLQQQQVIRKIVQFIVTLVQNNQLVSLKRKRPLLLNTNGPPKSTMFQQIVKEPADKNHHVPLSRTEELEQREQISDDIIIYDVTDDIGEEENTMGEEESAPITPETNEDATSDSSNCGHSPDIVIVEDDNEDDNIPVIQGDKNIEPVTIPASDPLSPVSDSTSPLMSSAVQLNNQSTLTAEDPVSMMDSILSENGVISQNINLLGKVELLDYLDSIDCSLEDFQAMLSGRQFSIDPDLLVDLFTSSVQMNPTDHISNTKTKGIETTKSNGPQPPSQDTQSSKPKSDKQLIQYTAFPLLAFLDGSPGATVEGGNSPSETMSSLDKPLEVDELLESSLDPEPTQSKLVRLEPLTEAEASEATLFYLCELAPAPMDTDMPFLDN